MIIRRKLVEASAQETSIRRGQTSTLHQWWARRPSPDGTWAWPDRIVEEEVPPKPQDLR